jgi:uncharacterized protein (DUF433 family)
MLLSVEKYPHLSSNPEICGGSPTIQGSRITVRHIAAFYLMGNTVDELISYWPWLTKSEIHSALTYYYDNQKEIDDEITLENDDEYWIRKTKEINNYRVKKYEQLEIPA